MWLCGMELEMLYAKDADSVVAIDVEGTVTKQASVATSSEF
jgi:hypothetical protein